MNSQEEKMKNKIKIFGLAGLLIAGSVYATDLPDRFKNYQERATARTTQGMQTPQGIVCVHQYDLTNPSDRLADVMEIYPAVQVPGGLAHLTEYPMSYWFDFNGDNEMGEDEILVDESADGINGNESWPGRSKKIFEMAI